MRQSFTCNKLVQKARTNQKYKYFIAKNDVKCYSTKNEKENLRRELPLHGIRVLDMSRVLAGPFSTQLLGDLGAEIIKIEHPSRGDDTRHWRPPQVEFMNEHNQKEQISAYYLCANRNKKSITVDIAKPEGAKIIQELAAKSHVFIENFKVGSLKKYGLDHDSLKRLNETLIYCSITSFGQDSSKKELPGYDFIAQGMSGLMSITGPADGEPDSKPYKVGSAIVDVMTGMYATVGILSTVIQQLKQKSNNAAVTGQHIDLSLFDVSLNTLVNQATNYLVSNRTPKRVGNSHPNIAPYESLSAQDGEVVVAVGNDKQFKDFAAIIGEPELATPNGEYDTNEKRVKNRKRLLEIVEKKLTQKPRNYWVDVMRQHDIPVGPINTIAEAFQDVQVEERNMIWKLPVTVDEKQVAEVKLVGNPLKLSSTPLHNNVADMHTAPPRLGEHTEEVLANILDYTEQQIQQLKESKVI